MLQLVLTGRALRRGGVGLTLFIVPVALTVTSIGVLATGTLVAATLLRASDQVLRYSVDKATIELLYLPVPAAQTFSVKSFIDTVVYRMGDGLGGLAVLVFATGLGWSPAQVSLVCLVLLGGWIAAAVVARREYVENLQDSIHQHRLDADRDSAPVLERAATEMLTARLGGDTHEIVYALSLFEMAHDRAIHPAVRGLLRHPVPEVRRRALALLARADDLTVKDQIQQMLHDPDLEVRTEALLYLSEHSNVDPLASMGAKAMPTKTAVMQPMVRTRFGVAWSTQQPAQMMPMIFVPLLSLSASNMRCAGAVKSVVACGTYSSCTICAFEPTAASVSLNAFTPSRPKA